MNRFALLFFYLTLQHTIMRGIPILLVKVPWLKGRVTWSAEVVVVTKGVVLGKLVLVEVEVFGVGGTDPVDVDAVIWIGLSGAGSV